MEAASECVTAAVGAAPHPLAADHSTTAHLIGISPSHLHNLEATGRMGPVPVYLGRAKRYVIAEVTAWIAAKCPARAKWQAMRGEAR